MSKAELEAVRKAELEAKEKERETPEWASGLKQQREAAERRAAMAADASKPFARSKYEIHTSPLRLDLYCESCDLKMGVLQVPTHLLVLHCYPTLKGAFRMARPIHQRISIIQRPAIK